MWLWQPNKAVTLLQVASDTLTVLPMPVFNWGSSGGVKLGSTSWSCAMTYVEVRNSGGLFWQPNKVATLLWADSDTLTGVPLPMAIGRQRGGVRLDLLC